MALGGVSPPTLVVLVGNLLGVANVVVIAFGIHHLTRTPDLEVAAWVLALTFLISRRTDIDRAGMLPAARTL